MADMTVDVATGAREFRVPFDGLPGGFLFEEAPGVLVLRTAPPEDVAAALELHFRPSDLEFQAKLPRLLAGAAFGANPAELSMAAARGQAVVVLAAGADVLARVPEGLDSLDMIETFLETEPDIFDPAGYSLQAIEVEWAPPAG